MGEEKPEEEPMGEGLSSIDFTSIISTETSDLFMEPWFFPGALQCAIIA